VLSTLENEHIAHTELGGIEPNPTEPKEREADFLVRQQEGTEGQEAARWEKEPQEERKEARQKEKPEIEETVAQDVRLYVHDFSVDCDGDSRDTDGSGRTDRMGYV